MTTKENLMKVGWVYLNHFENFSMFGRLNVRIIYDNTSKTVVGYYTENYIYFWNVTSKILEKFLKDLPDEKLAELKDNEKEENVG